MSDVLFLPLRDATANTFLLEGCACGLPVISTDLPSVRDYFPGEEAVLVQDNQPENYAQVIDDMSMNPAAVSARSAKARERAEMLSWGRVVKHYERLYEER
jgi:glycosyltransferase involved in cell wall biosynthesis